MKVVIGNQEYIPEGQDEHHFRTSHDKDLHIRQSTSVQLKSDTTIEECGYAFGEWVAEHTSGEFFNGFLRAIVVKK